MTDIHIEPACEEVSISNFYILSSLEEGSHVSQASLELKDNLLPPFEEAVFKGDLTPPFGQSPASGRSPPSFGLPPATLPVPADAWT